MGLSTILNKIGAPRERLGVSCSQSEESFKREFYSILVHLGPGLGTKL